MNKQGLPYFGILIDEAMIDMSMLTSELSVLLGVGYYTWVDHFNSWITQTVYSNEAGLKLCIELARRGIGMPWNANHPEDTLRDFVERFMKPYERFDDGQM